MLHFFNCFTELNLLQKVLLDLSIFNLEKVKLFNFDINLSKFHQVGYSIYNTIQKQKIKCHSYITKLLCLIL